MVAPYTKASSPWSGIGTAHLIPVTNRIEGGNPALMRLTEPPTSLPPAPELPSAGMVTDLEERVVVAGGAGPVSALIAGRAASRLGQRGIVRLAARALSRAVGLAVALGVDYVLFKLEEELHRDAFRAEIVAELALLRGDALAVLVE